MLLDNCLQATDHGAALTQRMLAFARRQELSTEARLRFRSSSAG